MTDDPPIFLAHLPHTLQSHFRFQRYDAEIHLPTWQFLFAGTRDWLYAHPGEQDQEPTAAQIAQFGRLIDEQQEIGDAIRAAIWRAIPSIRTVFDSPKDDRLFGGLRNATNLAQLIQPTTIYVHDVGEGAALIGAEFNCEWDAEHGLGLLCDGPRVLGVGPADTAIVAWKAKRAHLGTLKFMFAMQE